jgi:HK97 gp10 family phage protein
MISARATFTPRSSAGQFVSAVVTPAVTASVQASGQLIQQAAMAKCPVQTGRLRDSISVEIVEGDRTVSASVGPRGVDYANYVEYGTGRRGAESADAGPFPYKMSWPGMAARAYMRPAVDESRDSILELFASQISTAIKS